MVEPLADASKLALLKIAALGSFLAAHRLDIRRLGRKGGVASSTAFIFELHHIVG